MKYHILKTRFLSFIIPFFLFGVIFLSCTGFIEDNESEPDAQVPEISSISEDKTTTINTAVELKVGVMISDKGILGYQWYKAADKLSNGEIVDGAVSETFSPSVENAGLFYYYCIITNQLGNSRRSVTSPRISVIVKERVDALVPMIVEQPTNVTAEIGEEFSLKVTAFSKDGVSLSYQWYFVAESENISTSESSGDEAVSERTATAIQGATESSYFGDVSLANLGTYFCVVTSRIEDNGDGGTKTASVTSNKVIVSDSVVNANAPLITAQPISDTAIIPATRVFSVGAYSVDEGELSYQWYSVIGGTDSADDTTRGAAIDGATEASYKVKATEIGKTGYYCIVTNTIPDNGDGGIKTASVKSETAWFEAVYLRNVVSKPQFTKQPVSMSVAPYNQGVNLTCKAESDGYTVIYRWYESTDGTTSTGTVVIGGSGANTANFTTPAFTERGIRYFYCVATNLLSDEEGLDVKSASAISDVVSVAYTGLPVVSVNTPENVAITSKTEWTKNATISIQGATDSSWNFEDVTTSIRGRGNSTWVQPKKPYALKLDKKKEIMGMPKHKRWVLIANYLDNSFLRNEMAFYLSEQFGLDWTCHGKFVDLILNGEYKGLYWLGEAIKVDENRVNINDGSKTMTDDEDKDYLIEMDVYYDEIVKFKSAIRNLPYMIKNDDYMIDDNDVITTGGTARLERLQEKITALEKLLYPDFTDGMNTNDCSAPDESYSKVLDIDSWAKFYFVNEIMSNGELGHPKSCYFTFDSANNIFKAGPVWDFDWATLYASQANSCFLKGTIYYNALFKSPSFAARTKKIWAEKSASIDISTTIETFREQLEIAATYDAKLWGVNHNPVDMKYDDFDGHVDFLKNTLVRKFAVVDSDVNAM